MPRYLLRAHSHTIACRHHRPSMLLRIASHSSYQLFRAAPPHLVVAVAGARGKAKRLFLKKPLDTKIPYCYFSSITAGKIAHDAKTQTKHPLPPRAPDHGHSL